jgi:hypothetical protein
MRCGRRGPRPAAVRCGHCGCRPDAAPSPRGRAMVCPGPIPAAQPTHRDARRKPHVRPRSGVGGPRSLGPPAPRADSGPTRHARRDRLAPVLCSQPRPGRPRTGLFDFCCCCCCCCCPSPRDPSPRAAAHRLPAPEPPAPPQGAAPSPAPGPCSVERGVSVERGGSMMITRQEHVPHRHAAKHVLQSTPIPANTAQDRVKTRDGNTLLPARTSVLSRRAPRIAGPSARSMASPLRPTPPASSPERSMWVTSCNTSAGSTPAEPSRARDAASRPRPGGCTSLSDPGVQGASTLNFVVRTGMA